MTSPPFVYYLAALRVFGKRVAKNRTARGVPNVVKMSKPLCCDNLQLWA